MKKILLDLLEARLCYGSSVGHKIVPMSQEQLRYLIEIVKEDIADDEAVPTGA